MKLNKAQLKGILKECIKELIAEGAFDKLISSELSEHSYEAPVPQKKLGSMVNPELMPVYNSTQRGHNADLYNLAQQAASLATSPSMKSSKKNLMEQIFADTAQTTYLAQAPHEKLSGGGAQQVSEEELETQARANGFGSRWAAVAFAGTKPLKD